ncbi:MAG: PEPxxWA-CTERM sorting domain-containing protein [Phenylobacterium sp.]
MRSLNTLAASIVALAALTAAAPALAGVTSVFVPGAANPFLAGQANGFGCCGGDSAPGESPLLVPLAVSGGESFRFTASGSTDGAGVGLAGPDGVGTFNMADYGTGVAPAGGVGVLGLVGVFLSAATPSGGTEPAGLNFPSLSFASLAPGLDQIFWIGDGQTGTGAGAFQVFTAPTGATRLYLGTVDGFQWNNNTGGYDVRIASSCGGDLDVGRCGVGPGVPEPASWALMILGFGGIGAVLRSRRNLALAS